jgi:hypothetical protein
MCRKGTKIRTLKLRACHILDRFEGSLEEMSLRGDPDGILLQSDRRSLRSATGG